MFLGALKIKQSNLLLLQIYVIIKITSHKLENEQNKQKHMFYVSIKYYCF